MTDITRKAVEREASQSRQRCGVYSSAEMLLALRLELDEAERERDQCAGFIDAMADQINDDRATIRRLWEDKIALQNDVRSLKPEFPKLSMAALEAAYEARSNAGLRDAESERDAAIARAEAAELNSGRYLWLRDGAGDTFDGPYIAGRKDAPFAGEGWLTGKHADEVVDAARAASKTAVHGVSCPKASHGADFGHLHDADDDTPYDIDGVTYCGRCHHYIDRAALAKESGDET